VDAGQSTGELVDISDGPYHPGALSPGVVPDDVSRRHNEFYSPDLFETVQEEIGRPPSSYRVVSVGLYPDVAAYNGFHTLDGYQRLYPLAYKHQFRRIIAPELEKSDELRRYFDHWGSRCYVFSAELGKNYVHPKDEAAPIHLDLNVAALAEMGGRYVLSAVSIANASDIGLHAVGTFENNTSPYRLHVYRVGVAPASAPPSPSNAKRADE
jgi:hypothetical protein